MVKWGQKVQIFPVLCILTRQMSLNENECLRFEMWLHLCIYKFFWWDTKGTQSGISSAVMTQSDGNTTATLTKLARHNCSGHSALRDYTLVRVWLRGVYVPHLSLQLSRLSNSPVVEQLINAADEAVRIRESSEGKDHTAYLRKGNKKKITERERRRITHEADRSWNDLRLSCRYSNRGLCGLGLMSVVRPAGWLANRMWLLNNQQKYFPT